MQDMQERVDGAKGPNREQLVARIHRFGGVAANALLNPSCHLFSLPEKEGVIGYFAKPYSCIVLGDPLTTSSECGELVHAFHDYCDEQGKRIIYVLVSEQFLTLAEAYEPLVVRIECAEELFLNPQFSPREGAGGRLLRRKVKHAEKEGAFVGEYRHDKAIQEEIEKLTEDWVRARKGPQIHISHLEIFADPIGKRWFYAHCQGKVVGVLVLNALEKEPGWLLNNLMISPDAPNGCSELLVTKALESLAGEGCTFLSLGALPKTEIGTIAGLDWLSTKLARGIFKIAHWILPLESRRTYWKKFHPMSRPLFLVFSKRLSLIGLLDLKRALNISI